MKKLTAIILALATVICLFAACGKKQEKLTVDNFEYVVEEDGTAKITKYLGEAEVDKLEVPAAFGEATVTAIADSAFEESAAIKNVYLPINIVSIGKRAFANSKINQLHMESCNDFKEIGDEAFSGCSRLVQVDMRCVETIGKDAFADCVALRVFTVRTDTDLSMDYFNGASKDFTVSVFKDCAKIEQFAKDNGLPIQDMSNNGKK